MPTRNVVGFIAGLIGLGLVLVIVFSANQTLDDRKRFDSALSPQDVVTLRDAYSRIERAGYITRIQVAKLSTSVWVDRRFSELKFTEKQTIAYACAVESRARGGTPSISFVDDRSGASLGYYEPGIGLKLGR